ncbi:MAG: amidohydrolase family protein [Bacillota bacterium]
MYDLVIENGILMDPKTELQTIGNIGIQKGQIKVISRERLRGKQVIDASGKIVCPGFIDIHSHLHYPLHGVWCAARQGITTVLSGNCGISNHMPMGKFLDTMEKNGYPINYATLVGHSWKLREMAGLSNPCQAADSRQIKKMVKLAEKALDEGAFGISLGLEYAPGASREEVLALARLTAKFGKLMPVHTRTDALNFAAGLREVIEIMEETGVKIHISHLAYQYALYPEVASMALSMVDSARANGLPLYCDSGVYEAFATFIQSSVFEEGWEKRYHCQLSDMIVSSGKYIGERCTKEIYDYIKKEEKETVGTAFVGIIPDMIKLLKKPYVMVSTDSGLADQPGMGHPQDAGTYPRLLGRFVREQGHLTMMEAIKKSTWLPAQQLGLAKKGYLESGADADLVIFNPRTIKDKADYVGIGTPDAPPEGIDRVIVNGQQVVIEGVAQEDCLPGKILRKENVLWSM